VSGCPPWPMSSGSRSLWPPRVCRTPTRRARPGPARAGPVRRPGVSNRSMKPEGEAVWAPSSTRHHPEYDSGGGPGPFFS